MVWRFGSFEQRCGEHHPRTEMYTKITDWARACPLNFGYVFVLISTPPCTRCFAYAVRIYATYTYIRCTLFHTYTLIQSHSRAHTRKHTNTLEHTHIHTLEQQAALAREQIDSRRTWISFNSQPSARVQRKFTESSEISTHQSDQLPLTTYRVYSLIDTKHKHAVCSLALIRSFCAQFVQSTISTGRVWQRCSQL